MGCPARWSIPQAAVAVEVAIGISGRIGSGKTSLAVELADRLRCPRASFGDYVRAVATGRGLDAAEREVLQEVGDDLIAQGWEEFCRAVLRDAGYTGGSVVVDGIRHEEAARTMHRLVAPVPWRRVAVEAEDATRRARLAARGLDKDGATKADGHRNEQEVGSVMASADYIVAVGSTVAEAADAVMERLARTLALGKSVRKT